MVHRPKTNSRPATSQPTSQPEPAAAHLWAEQHCVPPLNHVLRSCVHCPCAARICRCGGQVVAGTRMQGGGSAAWHGMQAGHVRDSMRAYVPNHHRSRRSGSSSSHARKPAMGCTRAMSATWPGGTRVRGSGSRLVVRLMLATYSAQHRGTRGAKVQLAGARLLHTGGRACRVAAHTRTCTAALPGGKHERGRPTCPGRAAHLERRGSQSGGTQSCLAGRSRE